MNFIKIELRILKEKFKLFKKIMNMTLIEAEDAIKIFNFIRGKEKEIESVEKAVIAINTIKEYEKIGFTKEVFENYKQFEDEIISKGFTFNQLIENMEMQIAEKERMRKVIVGLTPWSAGTCPYYLKQMGIYHKCRNDSDKD